MSGFILAADSILHAWRGVRHSSPDVSKKNMLRCALSFRNVEFKGGQNDTSVPCMTIRGSSTAVK